VAEGATGGTSTTGLTPFAVVWPGNTTPQQVGAGAGQVCGWSLFNAATAARYVRFFDSATAPTMGTSVPAFTVALPAGAGANVLGSPGVQFNAGVWVSVTTGVVPTDNTAPAANDVVMSLFHK
jgi:hypothetical protein